MQDNSLDQKLIKLGFKQAQAITRDCAKTFYFASHFLSAQKRRAAYSVYAICRLSDDSVDNQPSDQARQRIKRVAEKINLAFSQSRLDNGLLLAFRQTISKYKIPRQYFEQLIEGMYLDLQKTRYRDFGQLYDYCYKVAGVVGLIMLKIFGCRSRLAERHAVDLGIAMQLTNILRDIKEDSARGRIYLPEEEMQRFGVSTEDISGEKLSPNLIALLKSQIARARYYYAVSASGIKFIEEPSARFVVRAMKQIYSAILTVIEQNNYNVFTRRAQVTTGTKLYLAAKALITGGGNEN